MILSFDRLKNYRGIVSLVDGSFDPLHPGHLAYFRAARSLGAPLLCNICPDSETTKKHPVLLPADQRAQILDHLDILTYVHVSDRPTVDVLRELQPRTYVKGGDWIDKLPQEQGDVCAAHGTRIVYTAPPTHSSSDLLKQFQPDVDAFERLVLSQKPADKPWEPTAAVPYDFESRKIAEGKHPELIRDVLAPTRALDYGAGYGHLVQLLRGIGVKAWGYEPYVAMAGPYRLRRLDKNYDLVICREVLEHLTIRDVARIVARLCALSSRFVYVTTRFNESRHFLDFATSDGLDPTHISIMPQAWLRHLFTLEGFKRRADLEAHMDWQNKGRVLVYERA